jgi:hypothetical protein
MRQSAARNALASRQGAAPPTPWRFWEWRDALLGSLARHEIKPGAFVVGIALSAFADNRTGESRPSIASIAKRVGLAVNGDDDCSSVRAALKSLERAGLLEIKRRGHMLPNLYSPRIPQCEIGADDRPFDGGHDRLIQGDHADDDRLIQGDMIADPETANYSLKLTNLPLSLGAGEVDAVRSRDSAAGPPDGFEEFASKFPFSESMSRGGAWREFARLCPSDQELAIVGAAKYASACERQGIKLPRHAATWLRDREFDEGRRAEKSLTAAGANARVFVARGTEAWMAWAATRARPFPSIEHDGETGWWFPSLFPLAPNASNTPVGSAAGSGEAFDMVQAESGAAPWRHRS